MTRRSTDLCAAAALMLAVGMGAEARESVPDVTKRVAAAVVAAVAGKSVAVVVRPEVDGSFATPVSVAALRATLRQSLRDAGVNVVDGEAAERALRAAGGVGLPVAQATRGSALAAKADLLLCVRVRRSGDNLPLTCSLLGDAGPLAQVTANLDAKVPASTGASDADQSIADIGVAVAPAARQCGSEASAAGVTTLLLSVRPKTNADAVTPGFAQAVYDGVAVAAGGGTLVVQPLVTWAPSSPALLRSVGPVTPQALAKAGTLPPNTAVMVATVTRRPGGPLVELSVVTAAKVLTTSTAGVDGWDAAACPPYPLVNVKVLAFSQAQLGKRVGNGECWTLAADALVDAKAQRADGYTFGRKLAVGETPYPGDIFQFTEAKFAGTKGNAWWSKTLGFPNHTAVVRKVLGPTKFEILEQNPGPVAADVIDFKDLKSGKWELWRPAAR